MNTQEESTEGLSLTSTTPTHHRGAALYTWGPHHFQMVKLANSLCP